MKPPQVKIAVITEGNVLRLRSAFPVTLTSAEGKNVTFPAKEIKVSIRDSQPASKERWLWCGKYTDSEAAEGVKKTLCSEGLNVNLLPTGLTPHEEAWQPREIRLLVQVNAHILDEAEVLSIIRKFLPCVSPVEIAILTKPFAGSLIIESLNGQRNNFTQVITLSCPKSFELLNAPVGQGFHREHTENLTLPSPIWISAEFDGNLCAGSQLELEDYLASVNSSEMPSESPLEFLKAQVVAARSWLLSNWGSHHPGQPYTVCGGDHCQCYYGLSRIKESSQLAVESTSGQVLMHEGRICDARYAKSCGGVTEPAYNVWPFVDEPYLSRRRDLPESDPLNLSEESEFQEFQKRSESSDACCSPGYARLAGELAELANLYRWTEKIGKDQLGDIIYRKTGHALGQIQKILPGRRGPSGRFVFPTRERPRRLR